MIYNRYFKNKSGETKTYFGIEFLNNEIKQVPEGKLQGFSRNDTVLTDLANGDAIMSQDGVNEYSASVADQIAYLQGGLPVKVKTEFEANELVPKFAKGTASFAAGTTAQIDILIPGTVGQYERFIKDGFLFTNFWNAGDYISKCQVIDIDNILGYGANTVLKSYVDDEAPAAGQGWYLWPSGGGVGGEIDIENAGGVGDLISGLYLSIEVTKTTAGAGATDAYVNIFWCAKET